jgi:anti-sigma B factor antagonist
VSDGGNGQSRRPESAVTAQHLAQGKTLVKVTGDLCGDTGVTLRQVAANELMQFPSVLAVDLSQVTRVDGSGIDALVSAAELAGEADVLLCLLGVNGGPVASALASAELLELFEIVASTDEGDPTPGARTAGDHSS